MKPVGIISLHGLHKVYYLGMNLPTYQFITGIKIGNPQKDHYRYCTRYLHGINDDVGSYTHRPS